jgi:hypothetical protein
MSLVATVPRWTRNAACTAIFRISLAVSAAGTAYVRSVTSTADRGGTGGGIAVRRRFFEFRKNALCVDIGKGGLGTVPYRASKPRACTHTWTSGSRRSAWARTRRDTVDALAVLAKLTAHTSVAASAAIHGVAADVGTLLVTEVGLGRSTTAAYSLEAAVALGTLHIASAAIERIGLEVSARDAAYVWCRRRGANWSGRRSWG